MKKTKKKNSKLIICILVLVIIIIGTVWLLFELKNKEQNGNNYNNRNNIISKSNSDFVGKLKQYVNELGNNFTIKYSGNFKNSSGEKVNSIVEYTKENNFFAIRSREIDIQLIYDKDGLKTLSNRYQVYTTISKDNVNINDYTLIDYFGQIYVKSYNETVENREYEVEEYSLDNDNIIKYYFINSDLKIISYDEEIIKVLRVENVTNKELFVVPSSYSKI